MERGIIWKPNVELAPTCPRCGSINTKFCYYNNYSLTQPRYFCKGCRRYWTKGGSLRNVPVGGGCRKSRRGKSSSNIRSSTDHGFISRNNLARGIGLNNNPSIDQSTNSLTQGGDHHHQGPSIDLALVYSNFLNSSKPQPEDHQLQQLELPELLPNDDQLAVGPSFEFSSMINMEFTSTLGRETQLSEGDAVYFSAIDGIEKHQTTMQHIINHNDHDQYTNMNMNTNINHELGNYMQLPPLPGEEGVSEGMVWSNPHDHMIFPNDILNTSQLSVGGLEPAELPAEPEKAQDPSHHHCVNADDGSLFSLSNIGNIFRP